MEVMLILPHVVDSEVGLFVEGSYQWFHWNTIHNTNIILWEQHYYCQGCLFIELLVKSMHSPANSRTSGDGCAEVLLAVFGAHAN